MIGDVNRVGLLQPQKVIDCYHLNLVSPILLSNLFVKTYTHVGEHKMVLNISSGAGRTPIDGWSVYCSTKAGMDMFSKVLNEELIMDNSNIKVLSLAPGIIDTDMQAAIRTANSSQFSSVERFINYKEEGELTPPTTTAQQVLRFIDEDNWQTEVICSVRDL